MLGNNAIRVPSEIDINNKGLVSLMRCKKLVLFQDGEAWFTLKHERVLPYFSRFNCLVPFHLGTSQFFDISPEGHSA